MVLDPKRPIREADITREKSRRSIRAKSGNFHSPPTQRC